MIQFSNPLLLAGLAAMVVPMVLHFLSRSRLRSVNWGAMMFLPGGDGRRRQASRLRQWLLLAMRCGMLGALATALALPRLRIGRDSGPTLAILILDRSASMGVMENERSRMDRAREAALNLLATLRPGDQAALIDATSPQIPRITSDLQALGQEILSTDVGNERSDFAAALSRALVLRREHSGIKSRIFIISDRQANNWTDVDALFISRWKKEASPPITWIPVGGKRADNVAIDSVRLLDAPAIAGLPAEIAVHMHNYGTSARGPIHLNLSDNSQRLSENNLTLEPREDRTVVLPVHLAHPGEVRLTASIDTDDLASDNARTYVLEVSERLPVLIITGEQPSGHFRRQADILQLALAPFSSSTTQPAADNRNPCLVRVVDAEQWNPQWFDGQRAVILADVPALSADQLRTLEQFTYTGGGLIIAPGNLVRADDFNQTLYRNATGISPASLSPPTSSDAAPTSILGIDLSHPIFQFLKGSPDPIPQATIARYFPANPHGGDVRVLASYATGEPFLVEGTFGHGHVLLVTTPLDTDWSNLPLSNFYLPFVQSCVKYLCAVQMSRRDLQPGEMIAGSFDGNADARSVRVGLPDGRIDECEVSPLGDRLEFRYGPVSAVGEYVVRAASPRGELRQSFILAPPAEESDLTPLSAEEIRHLQDDLGVNVISPETQSLPSAGGGEEISLWLGGIILVLVLALGEMVLAGFSGPGVGEMTDDLAAIIWGIHGNWAWVGVILLAVICVACSVGAYLRQMRTVPRVWWILMLTLRSVAFVSICLSLLQPTVLRMESASEAGGIAVLIDRSRSMSAIDTGDDPAAQVAAAAALDLFPHSLRDEKTLALRQRIEPLRGMLEETRRSLIEQQYSQLTQGSNSTVSVHMADLSSRWRSATSSLAGEPMTASLADLSAGINQPGWADRSEKKIDAVLANLAAAQVHRDADLYEHSAVVRQACERLLAMSRLDRARACVTEIIAHLPSSVPVYGAFFDSKLTPAILRKNGKSVWPADMTAAGDESDITGAVRELLSDMDTTPLRAILIISDGRQVGGTLASLSNQSNPPIFPVLCAGTPRDLVLHQLIAPRSAYLDEPLSIRAEIRSANLAEIPIEVSLQSGNLISMQIVNLDHAGTAVADFPLALPHVGEQFVRVSIPSIPGEASAQNNQAQLSISVAPQRIKIALLASFPNRDFQFLRDQLRQSPWIDSTVILPGQSITPAQLGQQQVIVLDDLAAAQLDAAQWNAIHAASQRGDTGLILIAGPNHLPAEYLSDPRLSALLPFDTTAGPPTWRTWAGANAYFRFQPTSSIAPFLSLQDDTDLARQWNDLPAMYHYLQIPRIRAAAQPLLLESESASPVLTEMPLGKGRIFFLGFNETWRWRQENIALQSRFWRQLVRHAAPLSDEMQQQAQPPELADLSPQPSLLARLASPSAAEVIPLSDVKSLWPKIQQYQRAHPAVIEYPLWHSPWLFAFVLGCFGAEWSLRKRFGLA